MIPRIIQVNSKNIQTEHIGCAIGNDKANIKRANAKKEWLRERFEEGLVFKKFDLRGKVFIEYVPAENVWKPIIAPNYMVINCLWVSGSHQKQGYAAKLLKEAIKDAKSQGKDGLVYLTTKKKSHFLTHKSFFTKYGFEVADEAPPSYQLLALKFSKKAVDPKLAEHAKTGMVDDKEGIVIYYSYQCPFTIDYAFEMAKAADQLGIPYKAIHIKTAKEAQTKTSPFGTFSVYYKGKLIAHRMYSFKAFLKVLTKLEND